MTTHPIDLLEDYALKILSSKEETEVSEHLSSCENCLAIVQSLEETFSMLAYALPAVKPPDELEERIMARISVTPQLQEKEFRLPDQRISPEENISPTKLNHSASKYRQIPRWRLWQGVVAGIAAILVLTFFVYRQANQPHPSLPIDQQLILQARSALGNPKAQVYILKATPEAPSSAIGTIAIDPETRQGVLVVTQLNQLPPDKVYELWLVQNVDQIDHTLPITTFSIANNTFKEVRFVAPYAATTLKNAGLSIESVGGVQTPDSPMIMLITSVVT
jgi:anti-sigma-K factor RskA